MNSVVSDIRTDRKNLIRYFVQRKDNKQRGAFAYNASSVVLHRPYWPMTAFKERINPFLKLECTHGRISYGIIFLRLFVVYLTEFSVAQIIWRRMIG
jgi:hypothetical protein